MLVISCYINIFSLLFGLEPETSSSLNP